MSSIPSLTAATRLVLFLVWTLIASPAYLSIIFVRRRHWRPYLQAYFKVVNRLLGIEVVSRGTPTAAPGSLFVANHASYLDILVLGSLVQGAFIAKREVAGWPGIGLLAKMAGTLFIERRTSRSAEQRDELTRRLEAGESLILFPEGTSNDGNRVLPFKSALFSVAERDLDGGRVTVQPVSVAYTRLDRLAIGRVWRPLFAWYGDMDLAPHLWEMLGLGRLTVEVEFHPPVTMESFASRKAMSDHCHRQVARGVALANAGRLPPPGQALPEPAAQAPTSA